MALEFKTKPWICPKCTVKNTKSYISCSTCEHDLEEYSFEYPEEYETKLKTWQTQNRMKEFRNVFKGKTHVFLPVIHCKDAKQTLKNCRIAFSTNVDGVWLVNHEIPFEELIKIIKEVRKKYPVGKFWIGVNFLDLYPWKIFVYLREAEVEIDGIWADKSFIDEENSFQSIPKAIIMHGLKHNWQGLYFGGIAFKYQTQPDDIKLTARLAKDWMDVVTTSGAGTGKAMAAEKGEDIRGEIKDTPIGLASGVSVENVKMYRKSINAFIVATSICEDFYNFDEKKLKALKEVIDTFNK